MQAIDPPMIILLALIMIAFLGRRKIVQALQRLSDTDRRTFYQQFRSMRLWQLGMTIVLLMPPMFVQMNAERLNATMMMITLSMGILSAAAWYFIGYNFLEKKLTDLHLSNDFIKTYLSDRWAMLALYAGFYLVVAWQLGLPGIPVPRF